MAESTAATLSIPKSIKIIAGADSFGCILKDSLVSHLRSLNIDVEDLGTSSYYSIAAEIGRRISSSSSDSSSNPSPELRGLVACGTGIGVAIFAATCLCTEDAVNARSINNSNVLAFSGIPSPEAAIEILDAWLKPLSNPRAPHPESEGEPNFCHSDERERRAGASSYIWA